MARGPRTRAPCWVQQCTSGAGFPDRWSRGAPTGREGWPTSGWRFKGDSFKMVGAVPARAGARLARLQWWLRWWARTLGKAERYPKKLNASTDLAISHIWAIWKMSGNSCFFNSHKRTPANMLLQHVSPERSDKFHIHTHFNSHVWAKAVVRGLHCERSRRCCSSSCRACPSACPPHCASKKSSP